jgi:hypothetical protein
MQKGKGIDLPRRLSRRSQRLGGCILLSVELSSVFFAMGIGLNSLKIPAAGVGDGEDDRADARGVGFRNRSRRGFQGGTSRQHIIHQRDVFASDGVGVDEAECESQVRGAVGDGIDGCLGGGVFQPDDWGGNCEIFSMAREAVRQRVCLVVAAPYLAGPVQRGWDQYVCFIQDLADALLRQHSVRERFNQRPAVMVFHFVDHFSQGFAKWTEGDDLLEWVNARTAAKGAGAAVWNRGGAAWAGGIGGQRGKGFSAGLAKVGIGVVPDRLAADA